MRFFEPQAEHGFRAPLAVAVALGPAAEGPGQFLRGVVEYDKHFKEVWSYDVPKPWAALRLKNGNTLITEEADISTREVNPKKETAWEVSQADIPQSGQLLSGIGRGAANRL